jgi:hypothetical protein
VPKRRLTRKDYIESLLIEFGRTIMSKELACKFLPGLNTIGKELHEFTE